MLFIILYPVTILLTTLQHNVTKCLADETIHSLISYNCRLSKIHDKGCAHAMIDHKHVMVVKTFIGKMTCEFYVTKDFNQLMAVNQSFIQLCLSNFQYLV